MSGQHQERKEYFKQYREKNKERLQQKRISLANLQVSVGGQNVLQSTLQHGHEHFLEQVNLAEQLTASDFGISTGLIKQNDWENSKWYCVNVERGNAAMT